MKRDHILLDTLYFLVVRASGIVMSFILFSLLAKTMTALEFGYFSMVMSGVLLMLPVVSFGRREVVQRFIPKALALADKDYARRLMLEGWQRISLGLGLVTALVIVLCLVMIATGRQNIFILQLAISSLVLLLANVAADYQLHVIRGHGSVARAVLPRDIFWRLASSCVVLLLFLSQVEIAAWQAVALVGGTLTVIVVAQFYLSPELHFNGVTKPVALPDDALRMARLIWLPNTFLTAYPNLLPIVVGFILSPVEAGLLFIAQRIANFVQLPMMVGRAASFNAISSLHATGETDRIQTKLRTVVVFLFVISVVGAIILAFAGELFLSFLIDDAAGTDRLILILCFGAVATSFFGPSGTMLNVAGHEDLYGKVLFATHIFGTVILVLMTLQFGPLGAATAMSITLFLWNGGLWWASKRKNLPDLSAFYALANWTK